MKNVGFFFRKRESSLLLPIVPHLSNDLLAFYVLRNVTPIRTEKKTCAEFAYHLLGAK